MKFRVCKIRCISFSGKIATFIYNYKRCELCIIRTDSAKDQELLSTDSKFYFNPLTPNDPYMGRTTPLTSKRCILYIYSTNVGTEYFKHALYSPFFFSSKCSLFHNANLFDACIVHILYTGCAEIKKNNSGAKGLINILITHFPIHEVVRFCMRCHLSFVPLIVY